MNINRNFIRRPVALLSAMALVLGVAAPALVNTTANAAGQATSRFVQLSDSTPSATGVSYNVSFKPTSTATIGGIVVDICSDTPIIGNTTCAYPSNFSFGGATPTTTGSPTGFSTATGSWVTTNSLAGGAGAGRQVFKYTNATAQTPTGTSTAISFTVTGVVNPSATGSFYARIVTFDTSANAVSNYTAAGTVRAAAPMTGQLDYGGAAMSTASQVSITATVQETLTFCVSGATITGTCGGLTTPTLNIGTGTPPVLTTAGQSAPAYTQLTTNALSGVNVRMKAVNACTNGGLSIAPPDSSGGCANIAGVGASAVVLTGGTWGVCVAPGAGVTGVTNYVDTINSCPTTFNATSKFGMNGTNVTGTYGDSIYTTAGAVNAIQSILNFGAMASNTTPAGVYQGNEILIATGTF